MLLCYTTLIAIPSSHPRAIRPRRIHTRHIHTSPLHTRPLEQPAPAPAPAPTGIRPTGLYPLRLRNQPGDLLVPLPILVRPYFGDLLQVRDEGRGGGAGGDEVGLHACEVGRGNERELVLQGGGGGIRM